MIDLGTLGGLRSEARGINSAGEVVGRSTEIVDGPRHGFLYTNKTTDSDPNKFFMVKLDENLILNLPDDLQGLIWPEKINDRGEICGSAAYGAILLTPLQ
jgi:probable HAF family extracellular repeat protein